MQLVGHGNTRILTYYAQKCPLTYRRVFFLLLFLLQKTPLWHACSNVYLFIYSLRWVFCSSYFRLHVLSKTRLELVKTYFPIGWLLIHSNLSSLDWFGVSNLDLQVNLVYIVHIGLYNNNQRFHLPLTQFALHFKKCCEHLSLKDTWVIGLLWWTQCSIFKKTLLRGAKFVDAWRLH